MFNKEIFNDALAEYKKELSAESWWNDEKFKWEAIKCFKDNWNVNAENFAEMLSHSLYKTRSLLDSGYRYPRRMIEIFAEEYPEDVRAMFIDLFDESKDIMARISDFKDKSTIILEKHGKDKNHYQDENSISVYLWLNNPEKYVIYKFGVVKAVSDKLQSGYHFKKGAYTDNLVNFFRLYDELYKEFIKDEEVKKIFESKKDDFCYDDPIYRTLSFDFSFYVYYKYLEICVENKDKNDWFPSDYSPNLTVEDWVELLGDSAVFTKCSLEIMKRIKDYGGQATCTQLSVKYGETKNFYNSGSSSLARRVAEKTGCPVLQKDNEDSKWWPVLYVGKYADKDEEGSYIWKLRHELSKALDEVDLSNVALFASKESQMNYWWLVANPKIWSFASMGVGDIQDYTMYNENGNKRRIFQNFVEAKAGDMIIGYESAPSMQIVSLARITDKQDGDRIYFEKLEGFVNPIDYKTIKDCIELEKMEFLSNSNGSLFKLTKGEYDFIMDLIREENPTESSDEIESYNKDKFLRDVYMSENRYNTLISVLENKKNIILQGAPGVGKTYAAKRLAYSIMGEKDENRIEFVQFHQSYSYEDFIMGYKPSDDGFELKDGVFYRFCKKAANQPDKKFFFIIDEINRGNLSKIFGELLMLIERDYRGEKISLAYNGMPFSVPKNLYIIGMMNTADRSLAMIDYALRRRFSFFDMEPAFDSDGFRKYQEGFNDETFDLLITKVQELNKAIANDKSLGKGFCIGHSYFCGQKKCTDEWMHSVVEYDILPMLSEYWFDDTNSLQKWENILRGVFQ